MVPWISEEQHIKFLREYGKYIELEEKQIEDTDELTIFEKLLLKRLLKIEEALNGLTDNLR